MSSASDAARLSSVEEGIHAIANGKFVVVVDDSEGRNEGDLIIAAEHVQADDIAFMVRHTSGVICVALTGARLDALQIPLMVGADSEVHRAAFTVSVDYRVGTSTGISAADRAATIRALAGCAARAEDFLRPGHVFPLRYQKGGVLRRAGHTEAAVDLARLAGRKPAGVLCEIVNDDGTISRGADLAAFARLHRLPLISIADLAAYRRCHETLIQHIAEARLPTKYGVFAAHVYRSVLDGSEHMALVKGDVRCKDNVLVRVHSECMTGDILGSLRCDCGPQLHVALTRIAQAECGVVVYLRGHEGRGLGLAHKLQAYELQDRGRDTVEASLDLGQPIDARRYDVGAQILSHLGLTTIRLMSNNPAKFTELAGYRLKIVERVPLLTAPNAENIRYLRTKQQKMGHLLDLAADPSVESGAK